MSEQPIGMLLSGIFGVILSFFLILTSIAMRSEITTQSYVNNEVVKFVDNARATGKISDSAYESLCSGIDLAEPFCEITIEHQSRYSVMDDSGNSQIYYFVNTKDEILETIYTSTGDNEEYQMREGDFLQVTVRNTKPTLATRLCRLVMPLYNKNNISVYSNYSGFVGNHPE